MGDRYRRGAIIARGGMGELYSGVSLGEGGFSRPVVIKRLLPHLAADAQVTALFMGEARLATRLHHQNIVQILDVGKSAEGLFLVMELVNGWDTAAILQACEGGQTRVPPVLATYIIHQVLTGLSYAYRQRVDGKPLLTAHRDISASNVLLSRDGEVKLADFGIARVTDSQEASEPGVFKGKYAYAAPEVLRGAPANPLTDQFSLGILLYHLLAGRHPFAPLEPLGPFLERLQTAEAALLLGIDAGLAQAVRRMLAKDPAQRFATTDACARELAGFLSRAGEPAGPAELSAYFEHLALGPPLLERVGPAQTPMQTLASSEPAQLVPSLSSISYDMNAEWQHEGPALSTDGALESSAGDPAEATASTHIRGTLSGPAPAAATPTPASHPAAPATRSTGTQARFAPPVDTEPTLELATHAPRVAEMPLESFREEPKPQKPKRRWLPRGLVPLVMLGIVIGGGVVAWPELKKRFPQFEKWLRPVENVVNPPTPSLFIDSVPSGARVKIDGQPVGETPVVLDNVYPEVDVPVEINLKGHETWKGTFRGRTAVELVPKLKRR
ncbi:MAG: protein kinase domain-containing protein [Myxococcaceae bacterium]